MDNQIGYTVQMKYFLTYNQKRFEYFLQENGMDKIHVTILSSKEYFRVLSTAKFLINDNTFLPFFIKKKGHISTFSTPIWALKFTIYFF